MLITVMAYSGRFMMTLTYAPFHCMKLVAIYSPGTGAVNERGQGNGYSYSFNVPLDAFTEDESFLESYRTVVKEVARTLNRILF